jgi:hypothetical protein
MVSLNFSRTGLLAPCPTPNLDDGGLHLVWPLLFELSGMGGGFPSPRPTPNLEDGGLHLVWPLLFELSGMGGVFLSHAQPPTWKRVAYI